MNEKVSLTGVFRYQNFDTDVSNIVNMFSSENPTATFTASQENWETYSLLMGAAYKVPLFGKFPIFPRAAIGPMLAENPGFIVETTDAGVTNNFMRASETGVGFAFELGLGLRTDLGRRLALMPTFTYSMGFVRFSDVETTIDNITTISDFNVNITSFNIGLSLAYKFGLK